MGYEYKIVYLPRSLSERATAEADKRGISTDELVEEYVEAKLPDRVETEPMEEADHRSFVAYTKFVISEFPENFELVRDFLDEMNNEMEYKDHMYSEGKYFESREDRQSYMEYMKRNDCLSFMICLDEANCKEFMDLFVNMDGTTRRTFLSSIDQFAPELEV